MLIQPSETKFPLVSVLFITYLRIDLLRKSLYSFLENCSHPNLQLVVTDDGSPPYIQNKIRELPFHDFALSNVHKGLAHNTNAGLARCAGKYILQIQDDWECISHSEFLSEAVETLKEFKDIGLIKLEPLQPLPIKEIRKTSGGVSITVFENIPKSGHFIYSDQPHIKTMELTKALGPYQNSRWMQHTELNMRDRFLKQKHFHGARLYPFSCFKNLGETSSFRTPCPRERLGAFRRSLMTPFDGFVDLLFD